MCFYWNLMSLKETQHRQKKKKKVIGGTQGISKEFATSISTFGNGTRIKEEFGPNWCQEKTRELWRNVVVLYLDEDEE